MIPVGYTTAFSRAPVIQSHGVVASRDKLNSESCGLRRCPRRSFEVGLGRPKVHSLGICAIPGRDFLGKSLDRARQDVGSALASGRTLPSKFDPSQSGGRLLWLPYLLRVPQLAKRYSGMGSSQQWEGHA
jgi:hypothetical protein